VGQVVAEDASGFGCDVINNSSFSEHVFFLRLYTSGLLFESPIERGIPSEPYLDRV
jgi:hypothetical protein